MASTASASSARPARCSRTVLVWASPTPSRVAQRRRPRRARRRPAAPVANASASRGGGSANEVLRMMLRAAGGVIATAVAVLPCAAGAVTLESLQGATIEATSMYDTHIRLDGREFDAQT